VHFGWQRSDNVDLAEFLVKTKRKAYASGGEAVTLADGSKEHVVEEGNFVYRDRYFGSSPFVGEEVVFENGKVIWSMNYYGGTLGDIVPAGEIYTFLQKAMRLVGVERPYRGPDMFREGRFDYEDRSIGQLDSFTGFEQIYYQGHEVYKLIYHGGKVS
jgi:hypothetical protein